MKYSFEPSERLIKEVQRIEEKQVNLQKAINTSKKQLKGLRQYTEDLIIGELSRNYHIPEENIITIPISKQKNIYRRNISDPICENKQSSYQYLDTGEMINSLCKMHPNDKYIFRSQKSKYDRKQKIGIPDSQHSQAFKYHVIDCSKKVDSLNSCNLHDTNAFITLIEPNTILHFTNAFDL